MFDFGQVHLSDQGILSSNTEQQCRLPLTDQAAPNEQSDLLGEVWSGRGRKCLLGRAV